MLIGCKKIMEKVNNFIILAYNALFPLILLNKKAEFIFGFFA